MHIKKLILSAGIAMSVQLCLAFISFANAEAYSPYSGKLSGQVVSVKSASTFVVSAETWPGFRRSFTISLKDISTPSASSEAKTCERELAEKALLFVTELFGDSGAVIIRDMTMETSTDQNAEADLVAEKGSVSQALINNGFARSNEIDPDEEPWC
ncbi:MAG: hypothetical protein ACU833_12370 [Gammaproteobacteria bacterium]